MKDAIREILHGKLIWLMTIGAGSFTFTLSDDEWKFLLTAIVSVLTGGGGAYCRWRMADKKKRYRLYEDRDKCDSEEKG